MNITTGYLCLLLKFHKGKLSGVTGDYIYYTLSSRNDTFEEVTMETD